MRIHLDTDLGGDPDDACALALLLGLPGVDLVGITTSIDPAGRRAGYVEHCLRLLGRTDVPVTAGAQRSSSHERVAEPVVGDPRYWPPEATPRPNPPGAATEHLRRSVDRGAVLVSVGPFTNLARLEESSPGTLARTSVVVMGGWTSPPPAGLPAWGPERDWNVQWDVAAAQCVAASGTDLTLSTLPASLQVPLRRRDLPGLRRMGAMGELLARQSEAHAEDTGKAALGPEYERLPDDLLNFHYDPLACAVAAGWDGARVERMRLRTRVRDGVLHWDHDDTGPWVSVVVGADGEAFTRHWLRAVARACGVSGPP